MTRAGADAPALRRVHTADLSRASRSQIRVLCDVVFDGDFSDDDWDHALGGIHVLCHRDDTLIGHAAVVQRQLLVDDRPFRVGYVEAVAVSSDAQRQGIGARLMATIEDIVDAAYDFGALGASEAGLRLYRTRGWQTWNGPLSVLGPAGRSPTPDDEGGVMVYGEVIGDGSVDLEDSLTADTRRGDPW